MPEIFHASESVYDRIESVSISYLQFFGGSWANFIRFWPVEAIKHPVVQLSIHLSVHPPLRAQEPAGQALDPASQAPEPARQASEPLRPGWLALRPA